MALERARLTLAFRGLNSIPPGVIEKTGPKIRELDLSHNKFTDLTQLVNFPRLETLVLDNNRLTSHTKIPRLPNLTTLWVNNNDISNLAIFLDHLVECVPKLRFLSLLGNEACSNFLAGGTLKQYRDYRYYVLNRLRNLCTLDSTPVSEDERRQALRRYGKLPNSVAPDATTLEQQQEQEKQKELEQREQDQEEAQKRREKIKRKRQRKLAKQKKRREAERLKAEREASGEVEEPPPPPEDSKAFILPDVDDIDVAPHPEGLPSVFLSLDPPIPTMDHLEDLDELTDDDDWSDEDGDDWQDEEAVESLVPRMARLPSVKDEYDDEFTDDENNSDWD